MLNGHTANAGRWTKFIDRLKDLDEWLHWHAPWLDRFRIRAKACGWIWQESSVWSFWLKYARNPVVASTLRLKDEHAATWRNRREPYWLYRLFLEFVELALALVGLPGHDPEIELRQIAAICMNWMEYRKDKRKSD
jgi:hypothetical protein